MKFQGYRYEIFWSYLSVGGPGMTYPCGHQVLDQWHTLCPGSPLAFEIQKEGKSFSVHLPELLHFLKSPASPPLFAFSFSLFCTLLGHQENTS